MASENVLSRMHHRGTVTGLASSAALVLGCNLSLMWACNTITPEMSGRARFQFAESRAIAGSALPIGAVFEVGCGLAGASR